MGRPQLNYFAVSIELDVDNQLVGLRYYDQEGCGHESKAFPLDAPVSDLIAYHDKHRTKSHSLEPRSVRCKYEAVPGVRETRCSLDIHANDIKHKVEITW